jgi:hypothetical protein
MSTSGFSSSNIDDGSSQIDNADNSSINTSDVSALGKCPKGSEVWDYFMKVEWGGIGETKTAKCTVNKCKHKLFSCGKEGTTRPLWHHLEQNHSTVYLSTMEFDRKRRKMMKENGNLEKMGFSCPNSFLMGFSDAILVDNQKLHDMMATWIINCQCPLHIVEDPELIQIFKFLNPTAKPVIADVIKDIIILFYTKGSVEMKTYLSNIQSKISFTLDLWTSPNNKAFVSATGHYIDDEWVLHEVVIDFGLISGRHDGENIADGFFSVLKQYDLTTKFHAITLDNASNNETFTKELAKKLKEEEEITWDWESLRFRCFNHILNLAAQSALNMVEEDISKIRNLNSALLYNKNYLILANFISKLKFILANFNLLD